jgi:hypothetical protein
LRKRQLERLDIEPPPAVIELTQCGQSEEIKYVYTAQEHSEAGEPILIVTFFKVQARQATFRVFFNAETFLTQLLFPESKWSNSTIERLLDFWVCVRTTGLICANEASSRLIGSFFHSSASPYEAMRDFQRALRQRQLARRHQGEKDTIDAKMAVVGELPPDFDYWINEVVLDFSRYIYYKRQSKRLITGYCTSCAKPVEFHITQETPHENVRHNQQGTPHGNIVAWMSLLITLGN